MHNNLGLKGQLLANFCQPNNFAGVEALHVEAGLDRPVLAVPVEVLGLLHLQFAGDLAAFGADQGEMHLAGQAVADNHGGQQLEPADFALIKHHLREVGVSVHDELVLEHALLDLVESEGVAAALEVGVFQVEGQVEL